MRKCREEPRVFAHRYVKERVRKKWHSIFLPGKSHGQRNLLGYSSRGRKESDTTEWLILSAFFFLCAVTPAGIQLNWYPITSATPGDLFQTCQRYVLFSIFWSLISKQATCCLRIWFLLCDSCQGNISLIS